MEENPFPSPSLDKKPASKKRKRFIFLFFAIVFILLLIYVGSKVLNSNKSNENANITPTPTQEIIPTDTPTPTGTGDMTPTPTSKPTSAPTPKSSTSSVDKATGLDRKNLTVTVQNGSGEKGVAGKVADILKGLGYNVTSTSNADNFNYSDVTIQVKSAKSDYMPIIKKDLSSDYTIGSTSSDLSSSSSADAVVIVGK